MNVTFEDKVAAYRVQQTLLNKWEQLRTKRCTRVRKGPGGEETRENVVRRVEPSLRKALFLSQLEQRSQAVLSRLGEVAPRTSTSKSEVETGGCALLFVFLSCFVILYLILLCCGYF